MFLGLKRIIRRNLQNGVLENGTLDTGTSIITLLNLHKEGWTWTKLLIPLVYERREKIGLLFNEDFTFSKGEYWVENSYCRLYSIVKQTPQNEIHYFLMFSNLNNPDEPLNIQWIYTGMDPLNPDPEITLKQCVFPLKIDNSIRFD